MNEPRHPRGREGSTRQLPFFRSDGRTVIVAMDHGVGAGHVAGLERPADLLERLAASEADGFILNPGMGRLAQRAGATPWLLAADAYGRSTVPAGNGPRDMHAILWSPADATRLGAAAMKVLLVFGRADLAWYRENLEGVARLLSDAAAEGVPVMVETTLWGDEIDDRHRNDGRLVLDAARVGFELGADVLKIPIPDDLGCLEELASGVDVPIVLMGGPAGDGGGVLANVQNAIRAGASGVAIGRNAWTRRAPEAFARALAQVVHDDIPADRAWSEYQEAETHAAARVRHHPAER